MAFYLTSSDAVNLIVHTSIVLSWVDRQANFYGQFGKPFRGMKNLP